MAELENVRFLLFIRLLFKMFKFIKILIYTTI